MFLFLLSFSFATCLASAPFQHRGVSPIDSHAFESRDHMSLTCFTWNLASRSVGHSECEAILQGDVNTDVLVLGFQEVEELKPRRKEGHNSVYLRKRLIKALPNHSLVSLTTHGSQQLFIFVRSEFVSLIQLVKQWKVTCGVGNIIQNKGALGIAVQVGTRHFVFINAHLAAHQSEFKARNDDFQRIMKESSSIFPSLSAVNCVVFMGDLNYRIDLCREEVDLCLIQNKFEALMEQDQLNKARASGDAFSLFAEGPINFRPTFKFDKFSQRYDSSPKRRIPAWTDRILFTPSKEVELLEYRSESNLGRSDHRAVVAKFLIAI